MNACQMKSLGSEVPFAVVPCQYDLLHMVVLSRDVICRTQHMVLYMGIFSSTDVIFHNKVNHLTFHELQTRSCLCVDVGKTVRGE